MPFLKLTAKRQATLPAAACAALGVRPGDVLELEPRMERGEQWWLLRPRRSRRRAWVGGLASSIRPESSHGWPAIRRSVADARRKGTRE
jgi:bifunctional DNA-binding transcriptional regulator/antitoxin component of YhaV-PrlF toxin-antitoxin module